MFNDCNDEQYFMEQMKNFVDEHGNDTQEHIDEAINEVPNIKPEVKQDIELNNSIDDELDNYIQSYFENSLFDNCNVDNSGYILTPEQADYMLSLYNYLSDEMKQINELCDKKIKMTEDAVNAYRAERQQAYDKSLSYLKEKLKTYFEDYQSHSKKKAKSVKLPSGTLAFRKVQSKIDFDDKNITTEFIKDNLPEYINEKVSYSIDLKKFKNDVIVIDDKCIVGKTEIPNIKYVPSHDEFQVK